MVRPAASLSLSLALATALVLLSACGRSGPKVGFGEACDADEACTTGLCVGDGTDAHRGKCTKSCGPDMGCPAGWSCSALTARGVAVCARGTGVPELELGRTRQ